MLDTKTVAKNVCEVLLQLTCQRSIHNDITKQSIHDELKQYDIDLNALLTEPEIGGVNNIAEKIQELPDAKFQGVIAVALKYKGSYNINFDTLLNTEATCAALGYAIKSQKIKPKNNPSIKNAVIKGVEAALMPADSSQKLYNSFEAAEARKNDFCDKHDMPEFKQSLKPVKINDKYSYTEDSIMNAINKLSNDRVTNLTTSFLVYSFFTERNYFQPIFDFLKDDMSAYKFIENNMPERMIALSDDFSERNVPFKDIKNAILTSDDKEMKTIQDFLNDYKGKVLEGLKSVNVERQI